jgi:hypothetical protein
MTTFLIDTTLKTIHTQIFYNIILLRKNTEYEYMHQHVAPHMIYDNSHLSAYLCNLGDFAGISETAVCLFMSIWLTIGHFLSILSLHWLFLSRKFSPELDYLWPSSPWNMHFPSIFPLNCISIRMHTLHVYFSPNIILMDIRVHISFYPKTNINILSILISHNIVSRSKPY